MSRLVPPSEKAEVEVDELMDEHLARVAGGKAADDLVHKKFSYSIVEDRYLLENFVKSVQSFCHIVACTLIIGQMSSQPTNASITWKSIHETSQSKNHFTSSISILSPAFPMQSKVR